MGLGRRGLYILRALFFIKDSLFFKYGMSYVEDSTNSKNYVLATSFILHYVFFIILWGQGENFHKL